MIKDQTSTMFFLIFLPISLSNFTPKLHTKMDDVDTLHVLLNCLLAYVLTASVVKVLPRERI